MRKDTYRVEKSSGYIWIYAVFFGLLTSAVIVSAAEETREGGLKALQGIPEDLAIVYGSGATHAERGRMTCRISADGMVVCEKSRGRPGAVVRKQEYYRLTKAELQQIVRTIEKNRFFSLDKSYSNPKIRDGSSRYITVTMDNRTHSVSVINTHQKGFDEIVSLINNIIGRKKPIKPE